MQHYKLLTLAILAGFMMTTAPVLADNHGEEAREGKKGKMFEKHDTNGDGQISLDEYLTKAKTKFAEKDTNGDGLISKEEAKKAHEAKREKYKEKRKEMRGKWKEKREEKRTLKLNE